MSLERAKRLIHRQAGPNSSKAFVFIPSQNWDGNDGAWSTFVIRVGSPAQSFRILPSTNGNQTWIPIPSPDCSPGFNCGNARGVEPFKDPSTATILSTLDAGTTCSANKSPMCINCISINGKCTTGSCANQYCCGGDPGACNSAGCNGVSGLCTAAYIGCPCTGDDYDAAYNTIKSPGARNPTAATGFEFNQSSTWSTIGNFALSEQNGLANPQKSLYGTDVVALGPSSAAGLELTQNSLIAGVATEPFYLGLLGLQPSNSSRFNDSSPSVMTLLKNQGQIPSLSYGYTAGALYSKNCPFHPNDTYSY